MNKSEKIICILLGLFLCWWVWDSISDQKKAAAEYAEQQAAAQKAAQEQAARNPVKAQAAAQQTANTAAPQDPGTVQQPQKPSVPDVPESFVTISNDQESVVLSTWGAVVKKITLNDYRQFPGKAGDDNPATVLDFSENPMLALTGVEGLAPNAAYEIKEVSSNSVTFANATVTRKITLSPDYKLELDEEFASPLTAANNVSLGIMQLGTSKNDVLSVDAMPQGPDAKGKVVHYSETDPLKEFLHGSTAGGFGCGCGGPRSADGMPAVKHFKLDGANSWIALKNRFFVTALFAGEGKTACDGFDVHVDRDVKSQVYSPKSVSADATFKDLSQKRSLSFYVGPKKQSLLWDHGMRDVMEFGMWRWLCYSLVAVLNFFYSLVPNYGVAIIFLTILVKILFWPLTHKSTMGMRKMQEIQPLVKEIQAKYKDNPQRLQQETWALYREHKVNPLSSCLPMLLQIPVFIALFTVLRSAVELRYAPFLWISDLSEPEGLFASWFPIGGGLNVLPILMAITTGLQSAFSSTSGDAKQNRMMIVFMPALMLFMFYSFPSALSLYWFLSNLMSIAQMWWIRKKYGAPVASVANGGVEVVDVPQTRQMRRHQK